MLQEVKETLEEYLTRICPDKSKILVDNGEGRTLLVKNALRFEDKNNVFVLKRVKESAELQTADLSIASGNMNGIFPGAIVHADSFLVDGSPNVVPEKHLARKPIKVSVDLYGNTQEPMTVERPDQHNVTIAINKMVDKWLEEGKTAAARTTFKCAMAYDEKQLDVKLGLKDAGKRFGVNFKEHEEGKQTEMLICLNQIYYSAKVSPMTASDIYEDSVTPDDLRAFGINEKNPAAAMVTSIDYGRQIVVKLSINTVSEEVEAAWKASFAGVTFSNKDKYKHIMENTSFSIFAYGGRDGVAEQLILATTDIKKVNEILAADTVFQKGSAACPLSYTTHFIDDASKATVSKTTEYVKTTISKRGQVSVKTDSANAYSTKHQRFYARPIEGVNEDGSFQFGPWECLMEATSGNKEFKVPPKYAEFGFEFDIVWGTDWPYSGVFWRANDGAPENILIEWGGAVRNAWIDIKVDGKTVFHDSNCSSHSRHLFDEK